jgi:hypothetical protein
MRAFIAAAGALALTLMCGAAEARDMPAGGLTIDDVVAWLQSGGYKAEVTSDNNGKHVESASGGTNFGVYMYDCKDDRCGSIQFAAGWQTHGNFETGRMNEWNRANRWARGYYDSSNDPWLEMDVDLTPGGTYELLNDELATWNTTLAHFVQFYSLR